MREYTYRNEAEAHTARRAFINRGHLVSLIAFDTSRDVYTFDVYSADGE